MKKHDIVIGMLAIIVPIAAVVFQVLLNFIPEKDVLHVILLLFALILLTCLMALGFLYLFSSQCRDNCKKIQGINEATREITEEISKRIQEIIGKLISEKAVLSNLIGKEQQATTETNAKTIWVMTPDFFWDYEDDFYSRKVLENVKNGKVYKYLFPKTPSMIARAKELSRRFLGVQKDNTKWEMIPIDQEYFELLQYEIALYDPEDTNSKFHTGIMADILCGRRNNKPTFDVSLDIQSELPRFITLFEELCNKYKNTKL